MQTVSCCYSERMFGSRDPYGFGVPRRRFPPLMSVPIMRRDGMYHGMHNDMYMMEEMARADHESMLMSEMLHAHDQAYFSAYRSPSQAAPRTIRPIMPKAEDHQSIRNTIRKTQIRLASKEAEKAAQEVLDNLNAIEESKSGEISIKQESMNDADSKEVEKPKEPISIGPKIPAKQMWESSYREVVAKQQESKSSFVAPTEPPKQNQQPFKSRKNAKSKKFKPYLKKKNGKTTNIEVKIEKNPENEFQRTCQVCKIEIKDENNDKIHKESAEHLQNVNKFITGNDKSSLNDSVKKLIDSIPLPTNTPACTQWSRDNGDRTVNTVNFCRLCSVRMTSLQHASQHYAGKSHAKRIRLVQHGRKPHRKQFTPTQFVSGGVLGMQAKNIPTYPLMGYGYRSTAQSFSSSYFQQNTTTYQQSIPDAAPGTTSINLKPCLPGDFANSMTPSGQYYCSTCNVVIEHAGKLNSHLLSKTHKQAKAMT